MVLGAILSRDRQVVTGRAPSVGTSATTSNNALPIVQAVEIPRFSNVPLPITLSRPTIHTSITTPNLSASVNEGLTPKLSSTKVGSVQRFLLFVLFHYYIFQLLTNMIFVLHTPFFNVFVVNIFLK